MCFDVDYNLLELLGAATGSITYTNDKMKNIYIYKPAAEVIFCHGIIFNTDINTVHFEIRHGTKLINRC